MWGRTSAIDHEIMRRFWLQQSQVWLSGQTGDWVEGLVVKGWKPGRFKRLVDHYWYGKVFLFLFDLDLCSSCRHGACRPALDPGGAKIGWSNVKVRERQPKVKVGQLGTMHCPFLHWFGACHSRLAIFLEILSHQVIAVLHTFNCSKLIDFTHCL